MTDHMEDFDLAIPASTECVWGCGRSDFNREHVVGQQFARRMNLPRPLLLLTGSGHGLQQDKLEIVLSDRVCAGCNGGWMKRVDDAVRGFMGSSIVHGQPVTITSEAKLLVLARWSMKVALLLSLWFHDEAVRVPQLRETAAPGPWRVRRPLPYVPSADFTELHRRGRPAGEAMIWIGLADVETEFFVIPNSLFVKTESGVIRAGYSIAFAMRSLAVYVVVPFEECRDDIFHWLRVTDPHDFEPERLAAVWPRPKALAWPPRRALTTPDMERLVGAGVGWSSEPSLQTGSWRPGVEPDDRGLR